MLESRFIPKVGINDLLIMIPSFTLNIVNYSNYGFQFLNPECELTVNVSAKSTYITNVNLHGPLVMRESVLDYIILQLLYTWINGLDLV